MAGTPAMTALSAAGIAFTVHEFAHDPRADSFGTEAAEVLGIPPDRVFKTLMIEIDGDLAVAIVPVSSRLDLKRAAAALGGRRGAMADPATAERRTGYVVGGISPLGQRARHRTVVDETVELWDTVLVSGGRRGLDVELAPAALIELTSAVVADVAT